MDQLYLVLAVSLVTWLGIFFYLARLDWRLKKMENRYEEE